MEVTIDPETGMLADEYCPQREKVVVPSKSFSNLTCLRHQPKPDVLYAQYSTNETIAPENYRTIELENETTENSRAAEQYKSINGIPVSRDEKKEKITVEKKDDLKPEKEKFDAGEDTIDLRKSQKTTGVGADSR
jgi:hypothetical protein